jgi:TP901-1 family phage major tail protein
VKGRRGPPFFFAHHPNTRIRHDGAEGQGPGAQGRFERRGKLRHGRWLARAHARLQRATVDITDQESAGRWRELLEGAGIKTARITGSGIFKDAASDETLRNYFFADTVSDWQVIVPDLGTVEGPFQVATLEYGGQHDGEVTFDLGLESAGALSFTAAA